MLHCPGSRRIVQAGALGSGTHRGVAGQGHRGTHSMRWLRRLPCGLSTVALVLLLVTRTATPQAERRVALVIGNGQYHYVPRLANPTNDAQLIADTLTGLGFTLVGGKAQLDLDKAAFDRVVQELAPRCRTPALPSSITPDTASKSAGRTIWCRCVPIRPRKRMSIFRWSMRT